MDNSETKVSIERTGTSDWIKLFWEPVVDLAILWMASSLAFYSSMLYPMGVMWVDTKQRKLEE